MGTQLTKQGSPGSSVLKEVWPLVQRELSTELRDKVSFVGVLLFVASSIFVSYLSFRQIVSPVTWNALFWIITVFASFSAVGRSFASDGEGRQLYLYSLCSAEAYILSKMLFNVLLMLVLCFISFGLYYAVMGSEALGSADIGQWLCGLALGAAGFALCLTLIAGIAAKARANFGLVAVLGFPVLMPFLVTLLRFSKNAMDGLAWSVNLKYLGVLVGLDIMVALLSYLLFPYLWRD